MLSHLNNAEYEEKRINFYRKYENEYYELREQMIQMNAAELRDYVDKIHYIEEIYCWIENTELSYEELLGLTKGKSLDELSDIMIEHANNWKLFEIILKQQNDSKIN